MPGDLGMLLKAQQRKIEEWCDQVPVLGFNSGGIRSKPDERGFRGAFS